MRDWLILDIIRLGKSLKSTIILNKNCINVFLSGTPTYRDNFNFNLTVYFVF